MALNIRLSPALDIEARAYCERVGISLNSLVGVALDAYLRAPEPPRSAPVEPEPVAPAPQPAKSSAERMADMRVAWAAPAEPKPKHPGPKARPSELHAYNASLAVWRAANSKG